MMNTEGLWQIHPSAIIESNVVLGQQWNNWTIIIGPGAVVGRVPVCGYTARDPGSPGQVRIGAETAVGAYAVIYAGCTIGAHCLIGDGVKIREGASIGDRVALHWDVQINYGATIGFDTVIGGGCHITGGMFVGARCFFGPGVMSANDPDPTMGYDFDRLAPPIVGNDVTVGAGAILLPGCRIGDGARIGAGAVVDGEVPAGAVVAAVRARRVPVQVRVPLTQAMLEDAGVGTVAPLDPARSGAS